MYRGLIVEKYPVGVQVRDFITEMFKTLDCFGVSVIGSIIHEAGVEKTVVEISSHVKPIKAVNAGTMRFVFSCRYKHRYCCVTIISITGTSITIRC